MWERGAGEDNQAAGLRFERPGTSEEGAHTILSAERKVEGSEGKDGATDAAEQPGVTRDARQGGLVGEVEFREVFYSAHG
eukprot:2178698-Prymnesium_polylepis.1